MRAALIASSALLACVLTSTAVHADSGAAATYSHADLKKMMREAHTTEQYLELASYFRWREQQFVQQAHDEEVEGARRSANAYLAAAKYPNPVTSSRNRYEYFTYEAGKMSREAAHYETLAAGPTH
jgi:hypothetical protein